MVDVDVGFAELGSRTSQLTWPVWKFGLNNFRLFFVGKFLGIQPIWRLLDCPLKDFQMKRIRTPLSIKAITQSRSRLNHARCSNPNPIFS